MLRPIAAATVLLVCATLPAAAQFNQFVGFGDSTIDTGWYRNATTGNAVNDQRIKDAVALGGRGAPVGVGLMAAEWLAGRFGLSALPANQIGGTNFATGGARNSTAGANTAIPTVVQIAHYLAASGGRANP